MVYSFNIGVLIKLTIDKILKIELFLVIYTNLKSLHKYFIKLKTI